ncbi:MAG: sigma-70 family RNA polymerase sigma factor [Ardenticatenaceae bacterium]
MPILEATADRLLSEQSVLSRVSHDPNAFFLLWPSYQHDLYRGCLGWMGNRQDAEDALSEIALKAWKELPRHAENISNLKGWLTRLSYNHCIDMHRKSQREGHYRIDLQTMIEAGREIIGEGPLPQELVLNGERSDYLCRAVTLLPERLREVVILRFWQDKSYQQIAEHLALCPSAVGKRLQEACSALSRLMTGYVEGLVAHDDHFANQALNDGVTLNRTASEALSQEAQAVCKKRGEIKLIGAVIYCAVQVTPPTKGRQMPTERTFILPLRNKPTRVAQRLRSLQAKVQRHPTGWKRRLELADFCYAIGRWEEAIDGYREVIKKRPRSLDLYLQLGQILRLLEREEEAISVYEDALSQARQDSTRHHLHGLIALSGRDYALAVTHLEAATTLAPDNPAHWHLLGEVHLATEAYQDALRAYDMALDLNPDDLIALSESYEPLVAMGYFAEALKRVRRTYKFAPHDLHAVKRLADHRSRMGLVSGEAYKETRKLIRVARKVAPQAAYAEAARATYYLCRGKSKEGVAGLREIVEKHPLNSDGWYHHALCLAQSGDSQAASDAILAALALTKNDYRLYPAACEILPDAGRMDELQPLVNEMLERFPERWTAWSSVGRALVLSGDARGCAISANATQLQPQLAEPWLQHGRTLALAGQDRQAIDALSEGYQYIPQEGALLSVRASVWLAESYQRLADETNSCKWWQEAARRAPELIPTDLEKASGASLAMAHYWQGRALEGLGEFEMAMQAYQTALDHHLLYPARQDALNRLSA